MNVRDIRFFAHCRQCVEEKPISQSPSEYARLDCGVTATGLLIWCKRHRKEVAHFTPEGLKEQIETAACTRCSCCPGGLHVN